MSEDTALEVPFSAGGLSIPHDFTETSLTLPEDLPYVNVEQILRTIGQLGRANQWWAGDALLYAESRFGEKVGQMADALGWEPGTIATVMWVCKSFAPNRRHAGLTFNHHQEVAKLPPDLADTILNQAEAGESINGLRKRWSVARLREELEGKGVRRMSERRKAAKAAKAPKEPARLSRPVLDGQGAQKGESVPEAAAAEDIDKPANIPEPHKGVTGRKEVRAELQVVRDALDSIVMDLKETLLEWDLSAMLASTVPMIDSVLVALRGEPHTPIRPIPFKEWGVYKWGSPEALAHLYNTTTPDNVPGVETMSPNRRKLALKVLKAQPTKAWWVECFEEYGKSLFLQGKAKTAKKAQEDEKHANFKPDFDWLIGGNNKHGVENYVRVHDGAFQD